MTNKHTVILQPSGRRGQVDEGTSVRAAARDLGVEIESICAENATCGKCLVLIEEGRFEKYNIDSKREHLSPVGNEERAYFAQNGLDVQTRYYDTGLGTLNGLLAGEVDPNRVRRPGGGRPRAEKKRPTS